jgi:hypothetical protein
MEAKLLFIQLIGTCFCEFVSGMSIIAISLFLSGSSVPSAFVLWVMRELPAPVTNMQAQSRAVTFISYGAEETLNPRHWVAATTSKNQVFFYIYIYIYIETNYFLKLG